MKHSKSIVIVVSVVLLFGLAWLRSQEKEPQSNKPTYINSDTNPYGAYIIFNMLKQVFDGKITSTRKPIYNSIKELNSTSTYMFVNTSFDLSRYDLECMLDFISSGNQVFISAERISNLLFDTLGIERIYVRDTVCTLIGYKEKEYVFPNVSSNMSRNNTLTFSAANYPTETLATCENKSIFIRVKFGEGYIYLHSKPTAFANLNLIKNDKYDFAFRCLSYIPRNHNILWDEFQKQGVEKSQSTFRVLLNNQLLSTALHMFLLAGLLYMIFGAKRIQRIIPEINPPANSSIEFLDTISNLYYKKRDYQSITKKRHDYFMDFIRKKYYLTTEKVNDEFLELLEAKSGVNKSKLKEIFTLYNLILSVDVSGITFLKYNSLLESFYTQVKSGYS